MAREPETSGVTGLDVPLKEAISAYNLQALLALAHDSYNNALYLRLAEHSTDRPFPEDWRPSSDQEIRIGRLTIGTPNLLQFLGDPHALQYVSHVLQNILHLANPVVSAAMLLSNIKRLIAGWKDTEVPKKARELYCEDKITVQMLSEKHHPPSEMQILAVVAIVKPP